MESRHDSVLRSRCPGIPKIPTFPDLDGTLEGECNRMEDQEDDGDRPATTSNGEKCPNPSSAGSGEWKLNCGYSDIWKGMYNIDSTLPPLFYFRDCVMGWLHCDVTCGLPGQYEQRLNWSLLNWLPLSSTFTWLIRGGYSYRINMKEKMYFRWTSTKMRLPLLTCRWNSTAMPYYNDLNNSANLFAIIQLSRLNTCDYLCKGLFNQHWSIYLNMPIESCFSSPLCSQTNVFFSYFQEKSKWNTWSAKSYNWRGKQRLENQWFLFIENVQPACWNEEEIFKKEKQKSLTK